MKDKIKLSFFYGLCWIKTQILLALVSAVEPFEIMILRVSCALNKHAKQEQIKLSIYPLRINGTWRGSTDWY